eukprot:5722703-Alexandrium_andersonii.AAC.1
MNCAGRAYFCTGALRNSVPLAIGLWNSPVRSQALRSFSEALRGSPYVTRVLEKSTRRSEALWRLLRLSRYSLGCFARKLRSSPGHSGALRSVSATGQRTA